MTTSDRVSLRQVAPAVYGPSLLFAVGQGAVYPIVALSARELGASVGTASLVVAVLGIGQVLGNLPAGWLAHRVGERRAMVLSTVVTVPALGLCIVAPTVWLLSLAVLLTGLASSVWGLARHSYLTDVAPVHLRARALSTLGGVHRIGMFIGPFLGALATTPFGTDGAYALYLLMALLAVGLLLSLPEPPGGARASAQPSSAVSLPSMVRSHARVLATLGVACLLVQAVRQARLSVLPLWAESIGLSVAETSLVFGIAGAVDMLLFYPAGSAMDRFGRVWVAVPSMLVLALGHALLPLTASFWTFTLVALVMGVGNGMGSGLVMTLGSDASPAVGRPVFLGAWRLVANLGAAGGPLVVSLVAAVATLALASLAVAGLGVLGAAALRRWTPTHRPHP
ncbi:MAG TPA: MFS transporter, partial [Actinomycetales bacterium]|nr:MFS transporter [Actinomycetales bacterium]